MFNAYAIVAVFSGNSNDRVIAHGLTSGELARAWANLDWSGDVATYYATRNGHRISMGA